VIKVYWRGEAWVGMPNVVHLGERNCSLFEGPEYVAYPSVGFITVCRRGTHNCWYFPADLVHHVETE